MSVFKFCSKVGDVVVHCEADCALGVDGVIVPLQVDAREEVTFPVLGDVVVFFESCLEVEGVAFADVLNAKVVNEQAEHNWAPGVAPEAGSDGALVVAVDFEALFEEGLSEGA